MFHHVNNKYSATDHLSNRRLLRTFFQICLISIVLLAACNGTRNKATLGNSRDTTSVNRAGGPQIRDTATVSKDRRDSARISQKPAAKGNADPSGRINNQ